MQKFIRNFFFFFFFLNSLDNITMLKETDNGLQILTPNVLNNLKNILK